MTLRIKSLLIWVAVILLLYTCVGCSAGYHITKARKKDPSLFVTDTVVVVDTIYIEVSRIDTLFKYRFDTVEFWKDSVYVKYFYQQVDSTVYLEIDCPDNKVIAKTETITDTVFVHPTFWEKIRSGIYVIGFMLLIFLLVRVFKS